MPGSSLASRPLARAHRRAALEVVEEPLDDARTTRLVLERLADDLGRELGGQGADVVAQLDRGLLTLGVDLPVRGLDESSRLFLRLRPGLSHDLPALAACLLAD